MSDDVKGPISLKIRKIPWDQALVTVMRAKGLGYTRQGNVLRISTLASLQTETEATNKILEAQKAIVPAVVQVIPASYANVDDLSKSAEKFLSKEGKVVPDNRTNTLIVTDKAEIVERIAKLVKTLDVVPPQVSIESKIVEAVEDFESYIGINWSMSGAPKVLSPTGGSNGAPITLTPNARSANLASDFAGATPLSVALNVGVLDTLGDLSATLQLAERNQLVKVISAPRISTLNREESNITQQGENVSIITTHNATDNTTTKTEKRTPFSLDLKVKPQITADGSVIMELDVQRQFLGPPVDQDTQARAVNSRRAKTKVLVRNGQTAVIGGIYTTDETEATNGVPGLMNIPVLGWLFKNKAVSRSKNELLIFMTPRILAADGSGVEANTSKQ
jgi:type IV pilus assembly protein PilQ